jgi:hypothetical protein
MKTGITLSILAAFLIGALIIAAITWLRNSDVAISTAGLIAIAFGVIMTFALGAGLMFLVFYSNRKGYDDPDRN